MPTMLDPLRQMLARIVPRDALGYARSHGWSQFRKSGNLMVFNRPEAGSLDQVLLPVDASRPDYAERLTDAVEKLATFEDRPPAVIATDLLHFDADVLRYRIASQRSERGTLPLSQAIDLLAGARQSILAAAHSALAPKKYHPKLSRGEAQQLLERCDLNQTEQRSFVVAISCPLRAVDEAAGLFPNNETFTRRTSVLLSKALAELDRAVEEERVNSIVEQEKPIISANLCEALMKMRPLQEDGILEFLPSWAPSTPMLDKSIPGSIRFSNDKFPAIEDIYRQMRKRDEPQADFWVAYVDELRGTESQDHTREGEVVFTLLDEGEAVRAKANLTTEQYSVAYGAHNPVKPLVVFGTLHRGPRVSRLDPVTRLERFDPDTHDK